MHLRTRAAVKRAAAERAGTCGHICEHHAEVMDPNLWSTLPEELVELVFARLPLATTFDLCAHLASSSMSGLSMDFRQICFERHPKLFGLLTVQVSSESLRHIAYDNKSNQWINRDLGGFYRTFDTQENKDTFMVSTTFASYGGLVCFVPDAILLDSRVRISNPLTDEWKTLPCISYEDENDESTVTEQRLLTEEDIADDDDNLECIVMVQLATEKDTNRYKLILVVEISGG